MVSLITCKNCVCTCACVWVRGCTVQFRGQLQESFSVTLYLNFLRCDLSLNQSLLVQLDLMASNPWDLPISVLQLVLGLQLYAAVPVFYMILGIQTQVLMFVQQRLNSLSQFLKLRFGKFKYRSSVLHPGENKVVFSNTQTCDLLHGRCYLGVYVLVKFLLYKAAVS